MYVNVYIYIFMYGKTLPRGVLLSQLHAARKMCVPICGFSQKIKIQNAFSQKSKNASVQPPFQYRSSFRCHMRFGRGGAGCT